MYVKIASLDLTKPCNSTWKIGPVIKNCTIKTERFTTNLPKAAAPEDQIKNPLIH